MTVKLYELVVIGVRESRMVVGDYRLTEQDCKACRRFADAIAVCNYDIDIHDPEGSETSHYFFPAAARDHTGVRAVDVTALQALLKQNGAFLGG